MTEQLRLRQVDITAAADALARRWRDPVRAGEIDAVYGIPRGGCVPATIVAGMLEVPVYDAPGHGVLAVDDLVDSGATAQRYQIDYGVRFDALYRKSWSPLWAAPDAVDVGEKWLVFPWELSDDTAGPEDAVRRLIEHVGEDPTRPGLVDTPGRVVRALAELTSGYAEDPATVLGTRFDDKTDEMVVVPGIDFTSLCEHHLLPFTGTATVGYLPAGEVLGLSKLARVVDCFARRLQVQERMTEQIADAIQDHVSPLGVGVVIRARHSCMASRGARKPRAEMVTSAMRGAFRDKPEARAEFLALARLG